MKKIVASLMEDVTGEELLEAFGVGDMAPETRSLTVRLLASVLLAILIQLWRYGTISS